MVSFVAKLLCFAACVLGDTARFKIEMTWKTGAPDGVEREMIFLNGQFPGPTLEIRQGDWVEMEVVNSMSFNTSIHAHGITQLNTPWADGVPGLSGRHIKPGESYTYKWYADQYGSFFYHAHSSAQIDDGCYGPIIVKPKLGSPKPFDKIAPTDVALLEAAESHVTPILVSDWRHTTSERTWELSLASGIESSLCMDSLLVNGNGAVNCWSREDLTKFTAPSFAPLLQQMGLAMTDKGCLPSQLIAALGGDAPSDVGALPKEVFDVCTPTEGSVEVIKAPHSTKWIALDIISSASIDTFAVSIDEHPMWIYAVDGNYIEPLKVDALVLTNGDRYSVFVELNKPAARYGVRIASVAAAQLIDTTAILAYDGCSDTKDIKSTPSILRNGAPASNSTVFFDQSKMVSFPPQFPQPAPEADQTVIIVPQMAGNTYTWALNKIPFDHAIDNTEPPFLYQSADEIKTNANLTITTKNNTWVDLIFTLNQLGQPPHPIHKHSNKAFVIGQGVGMFNWTSVAEAQKVVPENFNLVNPPYRDSFATPPTDTTAAWLAVRYHVVNPGAFLLHCHIQSHMNGGMIMMIMDGVNEWPEVPDCEKN